MQMRDAFRAGYVPPLAGRYFNGLELLAQASRGAGVELARVVGEEREPVVARRDAALALLDEAEALQRSLGADPVDPPADARGFDAWAESVFATVGRVFDPGSSEAVAHLLGFVLGEAVATLDAIAILSRLRAVAPDHLWMNLQGDSLERERRTAERRLARLASHPLLPGPVQTATAMAAHCVSEAGPSAGEARRATQAAEAAQRVANEAAPIEAGLLAGN